MFSTIIPKTKILFEKLKTVKHLNYKASTILFVLIITVVDSHSWLARVGPVRELDKLKAQKEYYIQEIAANKKRYNELKTDNENLEKFAREQYFMKKKNEKIFVVIDQNDKK
jgi:cell division protein FtsB